MRTLRPWIAVAAVVFSAVPISARAEPVPSPPRADLSSAERALRSYWARLDWYERALSETILESAPRLPPQDAALAAVMTGEALAFWTSDSWRCRDSAFERTVEGVAPETPSRAVVSARIRNVSPIPADAQPSAREEQARRNGERFRYVLERGRSAWKVAEATPEALAMPLKKAVRYPASVPAERWIAYRCRNGDSGARSAPADSPRLDLSTPQSALQSYWAQFDWLQRLEAQATAARVRRLLEQAYAEVATGDVLEYYRQGVRPPDRFERRIQEVSPENAARAIAVVRIRNVTPIPAGAQPSPGQVAERERGAVFRYFLQREDGAWKVASIWRARETGEWLDSTKPRPPAYPSDVLSF